ncbi:hypothetical protein [Phytoactinopolyspora endophytica]|uniref:hypothetical protein n=1 Tax=Phytoactinopolyspora endophytica TaxID=1642495 RepID=UPI00101DAC2F|nr:hypothetical protein [Phytoactinopolyspora endophytica]
MDWLPNATAEQVAMLSVIVSGVVALGAVTASLVLPRITSRWEHRQWLRDRRTECYDDLMRLMERNGLFYADGEIEDGEDSLRDQIRDLKARVRLYGSKEVVHLLDGLFGSFNLSRTGPSETLIDPRVDLAIKETWQASMKLLLQLQKETRKPMPRVNRRPIHDEEWQKVIEELDGTIAEIRKSLEP